MQAKHHSHITRGPFRKSFTCDGPVHITFIVTHFSMPVSKLLARPLLNSQRPVNFLNSVSIAPNCFLITALSIHAMPHDGIIERFAASSV